MTHPDSFGARSTLAVGGAEHEIFRLDALQARYDVARLPYTLRILLENVLRREDGDDRRAATSRRSPAGTRPTSRRREIAFAPARVLLQDFTGVPAVVDLAAMRDAMARPRRRPERINPLIPAELVIDHSVQVDEFATALALRAQRRARVRAQPRALRVPALGPGRVRRTSRSCRRTPASSTRSTSSTSRASSRRATGRRSRTRSSAPTRTRRWSTASACSAGASAGSRPRRRCSASRSRCSCPQVVGFRLDGRAARGRDRDRPRPDGDADPAPDRRRREVRRVLRPRASPACRSPTARRSGTCRPSTARPAASSRSTTRRSSYLRLTGRSDERVALVEAYCKENLLWHDPDDEPDVLAGRRARPRRRSSRASPGRGGRRTACRSRDAKDVVPRRARRRFGVDYGNGARRGGRRDASRRATRPRTSSRATSEPPAPAGRRGRGRRARAARSAASRSDGDELRARARLRRDRRDHELHEHLEPAGDGRRRPAREEGGRARPRPRKPWVKSSLAPGSKVVTEYYEKAGPDAVPRGARLPHRRLRLHDLHRELGPAAGARSPRRSPRATSSSAPCSRQPELRGAHPPRGEGELPRLAAARRRLRARRAGWTSTSTTEPLGQDADGDDVYLARHLADARRRSARRSPASVARRDVPRARYADVFTGDERWRELPVPEGDALRLGATTRPTCASRRTSTAWPREPRPRRGHRRRALPRHRSATRSRPTTSRPPARSSRTARPGATWSSTASSARDFNSYGSRRGNHEVMVRGTFANVRLRNLLVPGSRGHVDGAPAARRGDDDLRRRRALPRRGHAADRARRQGVRLGLVARLGGEGAEAARRARRDRRELRADPPLEPADDGRSCRSSSCDGENARVARPDRPRGVLDRRASRTARRAR